MAQNSIITYFIIGSIIIWTLMVVVIFKLVIDRQRELRIIRDIQKELVLVKNELKNPS